MHAVGGFNGRRVVGHPRAGFVPVPHRHVINKLRVPNRDSSSGNGGLLDTGDLERGDKFGGVATLHVAVCAEPLVNSETVPIVVIVGAEDGVGAPLVGGKVAGHRVAQHEHRVASVIVIGDAEVGARHIKNAIGAIGGARPRHQLRHLRVPLEYRHPARLALEEGRVGAAHVVLVLGELAARIGRATG